MTYKVKFTSAYKKDYKRAKKRGLDINLLDDVVEELTFYRDRLVLTDPKVGLNKERMELAIKMLGEKENE